MPSDGNDLRLPLIARCPRITASSRSPSRAATTPSVVEALEEHRVRQAAERERAGDLWEEGDWVFTNRRGRPVHPTEDHRAWKALLRAAGVRDARLHDARHTAATILLVLRVQLPAVMELMGWSDASVAKRYMHVTDEVVTAVAEQVSGHMWGEPDDDDEDKDGPAGAPVPA